jgi:hypothetical protein
MLLTILSGAPPTLERAQAIVGGYVELVTLLNGDQLLVNEDGRMRGLPVNIPATLLAGQEIVGHALLLKGTARWGGE